MCATREPYPTDVTDDEWAFAAPYLALVRVAAGRGPDPTAVVLDGRTVQSTPESGPRAGYDGHKRRNGSKVHAAVDTLGHLLALKVTAGARPGPGPGAGR